MAAKRRDSTARTSALAPELEGAAWAGGGAAAGAWAPAASGASRQDSRSGSSGSNSGNATGRREAVDVRMRDLRGARIHPLAGGLLDGPRDRVRLHGFEQPVLVQVQGVAQAFGAQADLAVQVEAQGAEEGVVRGAV